MKSFLMIMFFVLLSIKMFSQFPQDSCLKLIYPNDEEIGFTNIDSMLVDSCEYSPTFGEEYVTKYFSISFETVDVHGYPFQSMVEAGDVADVMDMLNSYDSAKTKYDNLDNRYKFILFRGGSNTEESLPSSIQINSEHMQRPFFFIKFKTYVNLDSAIDIINYVFSGFLHEESLMYIYRAGPITSINSLKDNSIISINPIPVYSEAKITGINGYCNYRIYDLLGVKVVEGKTNGVLNLSDLKSGIYQVRITKNKIDYKFTIIKD